MRLDLDFGEFSCISSLYLDHITAEKDQSIRRQAKVSFGSDKWFLVSKNEQAHIKDFELTDDFELVVEKYHHSLDPVCDFKWCSLPSFREMSETFLKLDPLEESFIYDPNQQTMVKSFMLGKIFIKFLM